jgi:preprotein translocase subunit SecE
MSSIARQDAGPVSGFWSSLLSGRFYKPSQGRIVRQVTFVALALLAVLGAWAMSDPLTGLLQTLFGWVGAPPAAAWMQNLVYPVGALLAVAGIWLAFRLVNYPRFADFLISVEAEMNKVSWPTRQELWRASAVVIFVIFFLSAVLFLFDLVWVKLFELIRVRY